MPAESPPMPNDLGAYRALSPTVQEFIRGRIVARLSADPTPCHDEEDALARVCAAIPEQIEYELRAHRHDPLLPMPDGGFHIRTCRCRAVTYANDQTLAILCPLTLTRHQCSAVPMREPAAAADARGRRQQHEKQEGRKALAATRQPKRIGIGGHGNAR
jgi:hypothetical protein